MRRPSPLPPELAGPAFGVARARELGVGRGRLRHPALARPAYGVRRVGEPETLEDLARATALALPPGSAFSHLTAARLLGLPLPRRWSPSEPLHVMRTTSEGVVRRQGCRGHRGLESREVVARRGLAVVGAADTWCDLAGTLGLDDLVVAGDAVVHHARGIPVEVLAGVVATRAGLRGARAMHEALPLLRPRSESAMETRARLVFLRGGLPEPELCAVVLDDWGQWIAVPDFVWREPKVAVEYDGDHHRTDRQQWRADIRRRELLADAGWCLIVATADDILREPRARMLVDRVAREIARRSPR